MTLIKTLKSIIDFLIRLPKETKEAIRRYKNQLSSAKGSKAEINMAKNDLLYFLLLNWLIKVLAPLIIITLIITLIIKYFIPILGAVFIGHLIQSHLTERKQSKIIQQRQKNNFIYRDVTKFMYSPLGELTTWLNIKKPQLMNDITIMPYYDTQNGVNRLYFHLLKKNQSLLKKKN